MSAGLIGRGGRMAGHTLERAVAWRVVMPSRQLQISLAAQGTLATLRQGQSARSIRHRLSAGSAGEVSHDCEVSRTVRWRFGHKVFGPRVPSAFLFVMQCFSGHCCSLRVQTWQGSRMCQWQLEGGSCGTLSGASADVHTLLPMKSSFSVGIVGMLC